MAAGSGPVNEQEGKVVAGCNDPRYTADLIVPDATRDGFVGDDAAADF